MNQMAPGTSRPRREPKIGTSKSEAQPPKAGIQDLLHSDGKAVVEAEARGPGTVGEPAKGPGVPVPVHEAGQDLEVFPPAPDDFVRKAHAVAELGRSGVFIRIKAGISNAPVVIMTNNMKPDDQANLAVTFAEKCHGKPGVLVIGSKPEGEDVVLIDLDGESSIQNQNPFPDEEEIQVMINEQARRRGEALANQRHRDWLMTGWRKFFNPAWWRDHRGWLTLIILVLIGAVLGWLGFRS